MVSTIHRADSPRRPTNPSAVRTSAAHGEAVVQRDRGRDDPVARLVGQVGLRDLVRVLVEQQEQQILLVPYVVVEGR
jgi:hypothetical protein